MRIIASLIKAKDGQELWTETYDRELKDIFAVQSEIAQAVAAQLKVKLLGGAATAATPSSDRHLAAYDAVLKSRFQFRLNNAAGCQEAIKYAEEATRLDPCYATAWAVLAQAWRQWAVTYETGDNSPGYAKARTFAEKALSLDPHSVDALLARYAIALSGELDLPKRGGFCPYRIRLGAWRCRRRKRAVPPPNRMAELP